MGLISTLIGRRALSGLAGFFTSLVTGTLQITGLTASKVVITDASKNLISGSNTDAELASAVSLKHARQHALDATADHTVGSLTSTYLVKSDGSKLVNATNIDSDVVSAVSLKHTQGTDTALGALAALTGSRLVVTDGYKDLVSNGALTTNHLPKAASSGASLADSQICDVSGNVGIGTIAPAAKLAINGGLHVGGDTDPGDNNLQVDGIITIAAVNAHAAIIDPATGFVYLDLGNASIHTYLAQEGSTPGTICAGDLAYAGILFAGQAYALQLGTSGAVRITIGATGGIHMGSGTSDPGGNNLLVDGTTQTASLGVNAAPTATSKVHLSGLPSGSSIPGGLATGDVWVDTTGGLNILKIA